MTVFEYDQDLDNGWNLDDNPFTNSDTGPGPNERGVVTGVEEQTLTLSEVLSIIATRSQNGGDAQNTEQIENIRADDVAYRQVILFA